MADITLRRLMSLIPKNSQGLYKRGAKAEFARKIGLKNADILWDWETGRTKSYYNYLYQAAEEYDVSVDWLKGLTDDPAPTHTTKKASNDQLISAIIDSLDRDQLITLIVKAGEKLKEK